MRRETLRQAIAKKKAALHELDKRREAAERELEALDTRQPQSSFRDERQAIAEPVTSREKVTTSPEGSGRCHRRDRAPPG